LELTIILRGVLGLKDLCNGKRKCFKTFNVLLFDYMDTLLKNFQQLASNGKVINTNIATIIAMIKKIWIIVLYI